MTIDARPSSRGPRATIAALAALICLGGIGCDGYLHTELGDGSPGGEATGGETPDRTDPTDPGADPVDDEPVELTSPHLRRLTPVQYENTARAALGDVFADEDLPNFGDDIRLIGLNNDPESLRVTDVNVASLYESTRALAEASVAGTPVVRDCVAASGDACFADIVDTLGPKLWRRPLNDDERTDLLDTRAELAAVPASREEQAIFVVQAMLTSPHMLFRPELGHPAPDRGEGAVELGDYEIASALSYALWNAPPDAELYELAEQGELSDPAVLQAQANRMSQDPRLARALAEFFMDYLKIEAIFAKTKLDSLGLTPEARAALVEGIRGDLREVFAMPQASLLDPFLTTSFRVDADSATFFGVPVVSDGGYEVVAMDPAERLGVLSHPAFLSVHSGEGDSGIVKRGVFTLEQLLCIELGDPPADISESEDVPADFDDANATSREVLSVRHSSQPQCVGCHQYIDPAGYGFENYDAAGRWRTVEKGDVQIDASGELDLGDEVLVFDDSVGYIDALVRSEGLRSCLSSTFMTYILGDEPSLAEREAFYQAFDDTDGDVGALVAAIVATPSFVARQPEEQ